MARGVRRRSAVHAPGRAGRRTCRPTSRCSGMRWQHAARRARATAATSSCTCGPTGPVRRVALIDEAIELMLRHPEADSLRSVGLSEQTPYKMWRVVDGELRAGAAHRGMAEPYCRRDRACRRSSGRTATWTSCGRRWCWSSGMMCGRAHSAVRRWTSRSSSWTTRRAFRALEAALAALQRGEWPPARPSGARHPV